jgi:hypothetical protein
MTRLVPAFPTRTLVQAPAMPRALDGDRLASEEDARESRAYPAFAISTPRTLAPKLPIWLALCVLVVVAAARRRCGGLGCALTKVGA